MARRCAICKGGPFLTAEGLASHMYARHPPETQGATLGLAPVVAVPRTSTPNPNKSKRAETIVMDDVSPIVRVPNAGGQKNFESLRDTAAAAPAPQHRHNVSRNDEEDDNSGEASSAVEFTDNPVEDDSDDDDDDLSMEKQGKRASAPPAPAAASKPKPKKKTKKKTPAKEKTASAPKEAPPRRHQCMLCGTMLRRPSDVLKHAKIRAGPRGDCPNGDYRPAVWPLPDGGAVEPEPPAAPFVPLLGFPENAGEHNYMDEAQAGNDGGGGAAAAVEDYMDVVTEPGAGLVAHNPLLSADDNMHVSPLKPQRKRRRSIVIEQVVGELSMGMIDTTDLPQHASKRLRLDDSVTVPVRTLLCDATSRLAQHLRDSTPILNLNALFQEMDHILEAPTGGNYEPNKAERASARLIRELLPKFKWYMEQLRLLNVRFEQTSVHAFNTSTDVFNRLREVVAAMREPIDAFDDGDTLPDSLARDIKELQPDLHALLDEVGKPDMALLQRSAHHFNMWHKVACDTVDHFSLLLDALPVTGAADMRNMARGILTHQHTSADLYDMNQCPTCLQANIAGEYETKCIDCVLAQQPAVPIPPVIAQASAREWLTYLTSTLDKKPARK